MLIFLRGFAVFILLAVTVNTAYAQFTLLPSTDLSDAECDRVLNSYELDPQAELNKTTSLNQEEQTFSQVSVAENRAKILACAIKRGRISFSMLPYFVTYIANFLLGLSGIIAVLFIVIGGYNYIYGGITDQKEKGKKTIMHALMGMWVAILSWVIVQVVLTAVTS